MQLDQHLLVFETVASHRSFSRAAEQLNMTQPAVSQTIQVLEDYYGTKLFERNNKRVSLTESGLLLKRYADEIIRLHQEAKQSIDDLNGFIRGRLRIGATLTIGEYIVPQVIAAFVARFPDVEVSLEIANTEHIAEASLQHRIDIGLVEGRVQAGQFQEQPFLQDEMILIVPPDHPHASRGTVSAEDVQNETFILREEGSGTRAVMEDILQRLGIEPKRTMSFGSSQAIKAAVAAGLGISFTSIWVAQRDIEFGLLQPLRITNTPLYRPLSLIQRPGQFTSRTIREFTDQIMSFPYQNPLKS